VFGRRGFDCAGLLPVAAKKPAKYGDRALEDLGEAEWATEGCVDSDDCARGLASEFIDDCARGLAFEFIDDCARGLASEFVDCARGLASEFIDDCARGLASAFCV